MTEPDDLESILAPPTVAAAPTLRDAIRVRTERVIRTRRAVRIAARIGAIAAVFLIGLGVGLVSRPYPPALELTDEDRKVEVVVVPLVIPIPGNEPVAPPPDESIPAPRLEVKAEQAEDRGEAVKLYRRAGDRYFEDQDYRNAARCYRLFLARAGESALQPETGDNWLLTSLKNAAFQEKFNVAKSDG